MTDLAPTISDRAGALGAAQLDPPPTDLLAGGRGAEPCRSCGAALRHLVVDLGTQPPCQRHVEPEDLARPEVFRPLQAYVCERCFLVQLGASVDARALFTDQYAYFSSYSQTWLDHARAYCDMAVRRFGLGATSRVVEVASNDGYLLRWLLPHGCEVLGVEPCANVAAAARSIGVPTDQRFFGAALGAELAATRGKADLIIGNNVMAHVPDPHDFAAGLAALLSAHGTITLEFPHLQRLLEHDEFDTIYHEHYTYLSLGALSRLLARHRLEAYDVEELPTHGGSLRVFLQHAGARRAEPSVAALLAGERAAGLEELATYRAFEARVRRTKRRLLSFLLDARERGKTVVGYGAPGKGNTLLNYCGVRTDLLDYTVDRSPHKQGRFLPGTRIPILHPDRIFETRPDYVLILPWNLEAEIRAQLAGIGAWGGQFVVPIPEVRISPPPAAGARS